MKDAVIQVSNDGFILTLESNTVIFLNMDFLYAYKITIFQLFNCIYSEDFPQKKQY